MTAVRISGKELAAELAEDIKTEVAAFAAEHGRAPGLAAVLIGDDPASAIYVGKKEEACANCGIYSQLHRLPADLTEDALLGLIETLNHDDRIDGILVQLPLPKHLDESKVIDAILPAKDVDCFHPQNVGNLIIGKATVYPVTPLGMIRMLEKHGIDPKGKHAVVVGRSNIVGKPMAAMLLERHATVTICHSRTQDLADHCRRADILVAAVGRPRMITGDMVKEGVVVLDVGVNRIEIDGKRRLVGDVDYDSVCPKASYITPVPGGVGPMTISSLLRNTLEAAKARV